MWGFHCPELGYNKLSGGTYHSIIITLAPACAHNGLVNMSIKWYCKKVSCGLKFQPNVHQVLLFADQISSRKVMKAALDFSSKHFQVGFSTLLDYLGKILAHQITCRLWPPCLPWEACQCTCTEKSSSPTRLHSTLSLARCLLTSSGKTPWKNICRGAKNDDPREIIFKMVRFEDIGVREEGIVRRGEDRVIRESGKGVDYHPSNLAVFGRPGNPHLTVENFKVDALDRFAHIGLWP